MKPQLFLLDLDPRVCAQSYSDEHLIGYVTILTEILRAVDAEVHPYKNNIITKWCGNDAAHSWVNRLIANMIKEIQYRFAGINTDNMLDDLHTLREHKVTALPARWLQLVPKAMSGEPVKAYREYYCETQQFATWTRRGAPSWFVGKEQRAFNFN